MLKVINMPAKTGTGEDSKLEQKKIDKNSVPMNQANAILNKRKDEEYIPKNITAFAVTGFHGSP